MDKYERRIIVEVVSPEVVSRLEGDIALLRQEMKQLRDRQEAQHRSMYRLLDTIAELKRQMGKS